MSGCELVRRGGQCLSSNTNWSTSLHAGANGMQTSISEVEADFRRSYYFEDEMRLHRAIYEAAFHDRSIPSSDVTPNDVLGGQGRGSMYHSGSVYFRDRCRFYKQYYFRPSKTAHDQWAVRRVIIDEVLSRDGRFLVRCCFDRNCWKVITYEQLHKKIQNRLWEKDISSPTVAGTADDMRPASTIVHPEFNWDEDHPSTVADNVVDSSPTSSMVNLDRNSFLDQDELVLDASDVNEDIDTIELDEADWSDLLSL